MSCEIFYGRAICIAFVAVPGIDVSNFEDKLAKCARMFPSRAL